MVLHITKKLADKLKIVPASQKESDEFYSWRANITRDSYDRLLVFIHDASRYVVVVQKPMAKDFKRIADLFKETLREALLAEQVNPEVIDRYILELGEVTFAANSDRSKTAWLNTACNNAWFATGRFKENAHLSAFASQLYVGSYANDERTEPGSIFKELLKRYGLPVIKSTALDLVIRLDLDGNDAIRQVRVPINITFERLHKIIQRVFDWKDYHLYSFGLFNEWSYDYYPTPDVELVEESDQYDAFEANPNAKSIAGVRLSDYIPEFNKILYRYDFGDDWHHYIEVEQIIEDYTEKLPILLSGEGDAPPEDVGGSGGFAEFLEVIANPDHEDYEHFTQWGNSQRWKQFDFEKTAHIIKSALWW